MDRLAGRRGDYISSSPLHRTHRSWFERQAQFGSSVSYQRDKRTHLPPSLRDPQTGQNHRAMEHSPEPWVPVHKCQVIVSIALKALRRLLCIRYSSFTIPSECMLVGRTDKS